MQSFFFFFFSSRRRHTRSLRDWSSDVCSSDLREAGHGAGIVTGSAGYNFADASASVDLVGASLPLANFQRLQSARFPLDGQVSFRLKASGPPLAPKGEGTVRVVDLRVGQSVIGSFDGTLTSDGRTARLELGSAMNTGEISGGYTLTLADPY